MLVIVKSYNCTYTSNVISYILPKCCKEKEPEDEQLCTKEEREILDLDFGPTPDVLREEYLDIYEGIQSEILNTTRFDEN